MSVSTASYPAAGNGSWVGFGGGVWRWGQLQGELKGSFRCGWYGSWGGLM